MTGFVVFSVLVLSVGMVRGDGALLQGGGGDTGATSPASAARDDQAEPELLGHGYSRQGDHIFFAGERIDEAGRDTLEAFARVFGRPLVLAHDVDAATFVALSAQYSKDKDTVYFKWISPGRFWVVEMPGADAATFEVMDFNLARDARRVWHMDVPVRGADAASAQVVHPGWVWKDRGGVYYQATRLDGADPASFRHLNQAFYCDATHVYWSDQRLEGADVQTFRTFGEDVPYAADARHVWFGSSRLAHVDAASFRFLHGHVFADRVGVYVSGRGLPVIEADPTTFRKVAELERSDCVLFSDAERDFLFDPAYAEVYTLTPTRDSVLVTKPVWFDEGVAPVRPAATVSAVWKDDALSETVIEMDPRFAGTVPPAWEVGKMQRMADVIREALAVGGATDDGGVELLEQRGGS